VHFLPHDSGEEVQAELPNAASTADVHRMAHELESDHTRIEALFERVETR
jgi:hypothetical protein